MSLRIDIGAGARPAPGFISVDLNPRLAEVVASADDLPFEDGEVEAIRAVDVLEHMSYRDTDRVLAEWARVAAPGCELYVQVPDADAIMRRYVAAADFELGKIQHRAIRPAELLPIPMAQELPATALAGAAWRLLGGHADGERVDPAQGDDWRWNAHYAFFSEASLRDALARHRFRVVTCITNPHPNLCCHAVRL